MAKAELNSALRYLRGRIGGFVYKWYGDKLVVTKVPAFSGKWSKKQKDGRSRFSRASTYAKKVEGDPELRASYTVWARKRRLTVRSLAISDFLRAPTIARISPKRYTGRTGQDIDVLTGQPYKMIGVRLIIRSLKGKVLEKGAARYLGGEGWTYKTTCDLREEGSVLIEAIGTDRLERTATLVVEHVFD